MQILTCYILYFWIYSLIGWACETVYCSIPAKHFVNRGFLSGPVCPIYGFGAIAVILALTPLLEHPFVLFIAAIVVTSALEYITSFAMEKLFHARWWDYSHYKLNINGRICLLNSTLFGIMSMALMYWIHPSIIRLVSNVPENYQFLFCGLLLGYFVADFSVTLRNVIDLNAQMKKLSDISLQLKAKLDEVEFHPAKALSIRLEEFEEEYKNRNTAAKERFVALTERFKAISEQRSGFRRRIGSAFPKLRPLNTEADAIRTIRQWVEQKKEQYK